MSTHVPVRRSRRRGFTLVELLIAILILAVGVISIASLLPVAISEQQRSNDDMVAPVVARNALSTIRSRVSSDLFGGGELRTIGPGTFGGGSTFALDVQPWLDRGFLAGDWGWLRPAFVPAGAIDTLPNGGIDIFNYLESSPDFSVNTQSEVDIDGLLKPTGIPAKSIFVDSNGRPFANDTTLAAGVIAQEERVYPAGSANPQYVWECMFRRRNGRVLVAIFVYRVVDGLDSGAYQVALGGDGPPLPVRRSFLGDADRWDAWQIDGAGRVIARRVIDGLPAGFDATVAADSWQVPGQLLLDQSGRAHQVTLGRRSAADITIELADVVGEIPIDNSSGLTIGGGGGESNDSYNFDPFVGEFFVPGGGTGSNEWLDTNVVRDIWYLPSIDNAGRRLVPALLLVEEL